MAVFTKQQKDSFKESTKKVQALYSAPKKVEQVDISNLKALRIPTTETVVMLHPIPGATPSAKGWVPMTMARPNGTGVIMWVHPEKHDINSSNTIEVSSITYNLAKDDPGVGMLVSYE